MIKHDRFEYGCSGYTELGIVRFEVHFNRDLEFQVITPHIFHNIQILWHMCNDCHLMHTSIISLKTLTIVETGDIVKRGEGAVNIISKSEYSLTV